MPEAGLTHERALWQRRGLPALVVLVACLLFVSFVLAGAGGDPMSFVGYDGTFSYEIAARGFEAAPYLDEAAYRFQRIAYPFTARLLALGNASIVPWTLILVNVLAIGIGTLAMEYLLEDLNVSPWYALAYGLYGGQFVALRANLNEPLAQAFVQLAMVAFLRRRPGWMAAAFAAAALAKETTLIFWAAYVLYTLFQKRWRLLRFLALVPVPFVLYQLFLWQWLGRIGLGSGGAGATPFTLVPLGGWLQIAEANVAVFLLLSLILVPMAIIPALAGLVMALKSLFREHSYHPYVFCLALNGLMVLFLPHSTFRETAGMVRLIQGLMVSMLLYGALVKSRRILNYSLFWIATNVLWVKGFG
ncbi:MAG TPA: hypothetical protein VK879_14225 [Candidatus Sulfomarinibacteraceae bacterium]|nr:hypothetical protein [Candidatus Sulfomarinibacteraceae bacterium]